MKKPTAPDMIPLPTRPSIKGNAAALQMLEQLQQQPPQDCVMCPFANVECPRPSLSNWCGAIKHGMKGITDIEDIPAWVIFSTFYKPKIKRGQQLSLFDRPRLVYVHKETRRERPRRPWHVAVFYCKHGRDWHIKNEKHMGAVDIRAAEISGKRSQKRPRKTVEPFLFCTR